MFAPLGGTFEDAATGSAAGPLGALLLSLSAIGALASAGMLWRTYGVLARPIDRIRRQMVEIANGNMSLLVSKDRSDEIGDMSDAFKSMFIKLRFDMADTRRTADAAQRMGFALDNVSTVVTVSNEENNLIYMNHAGRRLFEMGLDGHDARPFTLAMRARTVWPEKLRRSHQGWLTPTNRTAFQLTASSP